MNPLTNITRAAIALLAGAAVILAGCASTNGIKPTHALADAGTYGASTGATTWPAANWWSEYGDANLDRLIDQAIAGQPTLKTVTASLRPFTFISGSRSRSKPRPSLAALVSAIRIWPPVALAINRCAVLTTSPTTV